MIRPSIAAAIAVALVILVRLRCDATPTMLPSEQPAPLGYAWVVAQPIESERLPSPTDFDRSDKQDSFKNWDLLSKLSAERAGPGWTVVYDPKTRLVGFISGCCDDYAEAIERVATPPPPGIAHADLSHVVTGFGLHIGSTRADVEAAFGKPLDWIEYKNQLYRAADFRLFGECSYDASSSCETTSSKAYSSARAADYLTTLIPALNSQGRSPSRA
jgi:hypothetical protein